MYDAYGVPVQQKRLETIESNGKGMLVLASHQG